MENVNKTLELGGKGRTLDRLPLGRGDEEGEERGRLEEDELRLVSTMFDWMDGSIDLGVCLLIQILLRRIRREK